MPESKLDSIKAELAEELTRLNQNVKTLRGGLSKAEAERDKVKDVLEMLTGGKKKTAKKAPAAAAKKSTADGDHVLEVMSAILDDNSLLSKEELLDLVKDKLTSEGYALTGLKQRFDSLCDYPRFEVEGSNIRLGSNSPVTA